MNETVRHASDSPGSPGSTDSTDSPAITQTRLTHATHRLATDLLVDAVDRPSADPGRLAELRDFVVTHLRHHHETEDALLWPRIVAAAPETEHLLHRLSQEHDRLDDALDRLAAVDLPTGDQAVAGADTGPAGHGTGQVRAGLRDDVRPVLREARDEAGTPAEVRSMLADMPGPVQDLVPAMRSRAAEDLRVLRGAAS